METDLKVVEQKWADAELRGDASFLEQLLTDDFVGIGPRGFVLTKQQWLDRYRSGDLTNESFAWDDVGVRVYGDAAVVIGNETTKSKYQNQEAGGRFRTTLVFVRQDGRWLLAAVHLSSIAPGS